jgi:hypothetical protein
MSSINPLGRLLNLGYSASGGNVRFSLRDCSGILFVVVGATSGNVTIQECNAASGGTAQNLAAITTYWTWNNGVWTPVTQAAAATFTAATGGMAAAYVTQGALSDGFSYLTANHGSAPVIAILSDLDVQRTPGNLRDVRA